MNLRLQLCVFACVYVREEETESEKQRQEGKEEKSDAVFAGMCETDLPTRCP